MSPIKVVQCYILIWIFSHFYIMRSETFRLKLTKIECPHFDKSVMIVKTCRLKAVSRNLQYATLEVHFPVLPIQNFKGDFRFMRKASGYKPFLYNFTFTCSILKHLNPVTTIVRQWFRDNTNLNLTCPLTSNIPSYIYFIKTDFSLPRLENTYLERALQPLPIPLGEYALFTHWVLNNNTAFEANFFALLY